MNLRSEDGFTLIELLISIVILGLISGALVGSIIVGLRTTDDANQRYSLSHDAQIAAAYFANDVQSADVTTTTTVSTSDATCDPAVGTFVVRFKWIDGVSTNVASYALGVRSGGQRLLWRSVCVNSVFQHHDTISHYVDSSGLTCPSESGGVCPANGKPKQVELVLNDCYMTPTNVCVPGTNYSFTLKGSRRAS